MEKTAEVVIVGAGSGGLSAYHVIKKTTPEVLVIQDGPHGTTCARVGCMPSKVLIQVANDFYRRKVFASEGIHGADSLEVNIPEAMQFVRKLRDRFVRGVMGTVEELGDRVILGRARFLEPLLLEVNGQRVRAKKAVILATGSTPIVPKGWKGLNVLTSDSIFEQEDFPRRVAVVGTGVIGLELGQALHRLGLDVHLLGRSGKMGGLSVPEINQYALKSFQNEMTFTLTKKLQATKNGQGIHIETDHGSIEVDQVLAALGRTPNVSGIGLEELGVSLDKKGIPEFNRQTMQVGNLPVFIAGDVTNELPILHEASDEGRIAGHNALASSPGQFHRRVPTQIVFCDPQIAQVGECPESAAYGEVTFEGQGRSIVMSKENGLLRVYGEPQSGRLLGAQMIAPSAEHLAHLLSWAIQTGLTVFDVLKLPFYHPVVEEGLRTALRDLKQKIDPSLTEHEIARAE